MDSEGQKQGFNCTWQLLAPTKNTSTEPWDNNSNNNLSSIDEGRDTASLYQLTVPIGYQ